MKYILLIYEAEAIWKNKSESERRKTIQGHRAFAETLQADGIEFSGAALMPTTTATTVRNRDGRKKILDGPFAETKENLAGLYVIDCASLDDALDYAAMIPNVETGSIEVRPSADHSGYAR